MMKFYKKAVAVSILGFCASAAMADAYIGAAIGNTDVHYGGIEDETSLSVSGGYKFNKNLSVEASYISLGDFGDSPSKAFNFAGVATIPVTENFDIFGKMGLFLLGAASNIEDASDINISYGVGASYSFTTNISMIVEYQYFDLASGMSNTSVGLRYNF